MHFLNQANDACEFAWKIYFKVQIAYTVIMAITYSISIPVSYWIYGRLDVDNFYHMVKMMWVRLFFKNQNKFKNQEWLDFRLPWDQSTIFGYFGELIQMMTVTQIFFLVNGVSLMLFISICFYHRAFLKILKNSIDEWNSQDKKTRNDAKFICDLIRFHISAKE